jgi:hypothetical protein
LALGHESAGQTEEEPDEWGGLDRMQMGEGPAEHSEEELSDPKTKYVTAPQVPQAPQAPQAPRATRLAPQIPRTSSLDSDSYAKSPLTRVVRSIQKSHFGCEMAEKLWILGETWNLN